MNDDIQWRLCLTLVHLISYLITRNSALPSEGRECFRPLFSRTESFVSIVISWEKHQLLSWLQTLCSGMPVSFLKQPGGRSRHIRAIYSYSRLTMHTEAYFLFTWTVPQEFWLISGPQDSMWVVLGHSAVIKKSKVVKPNYKLQRPNLGGSRTRKITIMLQPPQLNWTFW